MADERYERGMMKRREVMGGDYVDRAVENTTDFDAEFQRFIAEVPWGSVWARDTLPTRERHIITLSVLATLGRERELALHIRATLNTGILREELAEIFMHVAAYAGAPAGNSAVAVAKRR